MVIKWDDFEGGREIGKSEFSMELCVWRFEVFCINGGTGIITFRFRGLVIELSLNS